MKSSHSNMSGKPKKKRKTKGISKDEVKSGNKKKEKKKTHPSQIPGASCLIHLSHSLELEND